MIPHWKQKFVLLWTGQALSILSSMVSQYALIWYLTDLTGSPAVLSLATMAAMVPQGVLSLFTGAFADRFDRRIIMMVSDGAIGLISLALAALAFAGPLPVAPILVVAALRSVGGAFHSPCIQAVTPLIAPPESLTRCAGWSQGIQTVSMLLSPALASVLYAHVPLAWILLLDTLGAVFAIGGVLLARLPVLRAGAHGAPLRLWQDTREGLAVLRSHRWLWELTLICALFSVAFLPVSALFPLMSMDYFGGAAASAAWVTGVFDPELDTQTRLLSLLLIAALLVLYLILGWFVSCAFQQHSPLALFILIGYLAQLVPWFFIGRITFAYHYFPSVLFLVLALCYVFHTLAEREEMVNWKPAMFAVTGGAVGLYALFYPVLVGIQIPTWYSNNVLGWFPSWPF